MRYSVSCGNFITVLEEAGMLLIYIRRFKEIGTEVSELRTTLIELTLDLNNEVECIGERIV